MKNGKRLFSVLLALTLLFSFSLSAFASEIPEVEKDSSKIIENLDPIGKLPKNEQNNNGTATPLPKNEQNNNTVTPQIITPPPVKFPVYSCTVTNTWSGYKWRGWQVSGGTGGTVTLSQTFGVSNGVTGTIKIPISQVDVTVGYNTSWSSSMTASYSHPIASGKYGHIGYDDRYDNTCKDFDTQIDWYNDPLHLSFDSTEYGSGQSWAWTRFAYYYGETSSVNTLPSVPH